MTLAISNLDYAYGRHKALHGVDIEALRPGSMTALIGPNAAGKSTLFKCISGLLKPDAGQIFLNGKDLAKTSHAERVRRVCYLPQHFASNAALTVFDAVLLARKNLERWRVDRADVEAVSRVLCDLSIEHIAEIYIGDLSGGQQQMVSIAQSLVRDPEVFLFDEPTSALDLRRKLEVMTAVKSMAERRRSLCIVALHDLDLAARFADHLVLIRQGSVEAQGSPDDVLPTSAVEKTYGVSIKLTKSPHGITHVHASLA